MTQKIAQNQIFSAKENDEDPRLRLKKLESERTKVVLETKYLKSPSISQSTATTTESNSKETQNTLSKKPPAKKLSKRAHKISVPHFLFDEGLFKTKRDQRFTILFYGGYQKASYKKIGDYFKISKDNAKKELINKWIASGDIKKVNNLYKPDLYIPSKGRNCLIQGENYYVLTKQGRDRRKNLLDGVVKKCKEKTYCVEEKVLQEICKVNSSTNFKEIIAPLQNNSSLRSERKEPRGTAVPSKSSFEKPNLNSGRALEGRDFKIGGVANEVCVDLHQILGICIAKTRRKSLNSKKFSQTSHLAKESFKNTEKFRAIQKLFTKYKLNKMLDKAYRASLLKLMTLSMEFIEKLLKLIRSKLKHKWKLRYFWGFFMSEVRKLPDRRRFSDPWFKMLSKEYRDASDGKKNKVTEGVDSNIIAQGISKLEEETGEKISEKTLQRMLYHKTEKVKSAVDTVCYIKGLEKGELPKEKAAREAEEVQKPKIRPIIKQVKINTETKKPYTDEDFSADKPFAFTNKTVGYEPINGQEQAQKPQPSQREAKPQKERTKIRSWIGMLFFALDMDGTEAIKKAFFEKREAVG